MEKRYVAPCKEKPELTFVLEPWQVIQESSTGIYVQLQKGRRQGRVKINQLQYEKLENGNYEVHVRKFDRFSFLDDQSFESSSILYGTTLASQLARDNGEVPVKRNWVMNNVEMMAETLGCSINIIFKVKRHSSIWGMHFLNKWKRRNKHFKCFKKESNYPCGDRRIKNKNLFSKGKTKKHRFSHCVVHIGKDKEKIQNFRVTPGTLIYTRSDEGMGYTVHIFREFCNDVGILKYNIINFGIICISYKYILDNNTALIKKNFFNQSIREYKHEKLHLALDIMESNVIL